MTKFEHYDKNGVYDLRLSTGDTQMLVVTKQASNHIEGYVAETHPGTLEDPKKPFVRVDADRVSLRRSAIIGKRFVGAFRSFDAFEFPKDGPTSLILDVPEDARDGVAYDYEVVSCPDDGCTWEDDVERLCAGDRCPKCGTNVPTDGE